MRFILTVLMLSVFVVFPITGSASPVVGKRGVVAAAHPAAAKAGVDILRQGGNAADAAAATAFALAVVEPYSSGLGGGGFALLRFGQSVQFLDFRETAPKGAKRDMYVVEGKADNTISRDGILSAAVPGAVAGYLELQERYGKLSRQQVLQPAIELAEKGFPVTNRYIKYANWRLELLRRDPESTRIFLRAGEDGLAHPPGLEDKIIQADLAQSIRLIAKQGAKAFYQGEIAQKLAADMQARGGLIELTDLNGYAVRYRQPLIGSYHGHAVASSPPPSSGGQILLTILNVMETLPADTPWRSPHALHLYIEASKRAFADRALLGDPDYVPYLAGLMPYLIAKDRGQLLAQVIGKQATQATHIPAGQGAQLPLDVPRDQHGSMSQGTDTTHLSVVDHEGNAVSLTTTVNYGWGAGVVARGTGILWNDEMDDFAVAPGVPNAYGIVGSTANAVAPGKVPLSSMSPTMVFSGADVKSPVQLVVGSPGGSRIPTTVAQAIMHYLDHGLDVEEAITAGRVHHQHLPDVVSIEHRALDQATINALVAMGHAVKERSTWSNATIIAIDPKTGLRTGSADRRGIGVAIAE